MFEHLKSHQDGVLFLGSALMSLVLFCFLIPAIWTTTLPTDSPETVIADQRWEGRGRSSRLVSYIDAPSGWYRCRGAIRAGRGTVVVYDPSWPSRCRRPEDLWKFVGFERLVFGLLVLSVMAMIYSVIAFFFLAGDRSPVE